MAKSLCSWKARDLQEASHDQRPSAFGREHARAPLWTPFSSTAGELTSSTGDAHFATKRGAMITASGWESETTTTAAAVPEEAPVEEEASTLTAH
jgi:hypothetical protein